MQLLCSVRKSQVITKLHWWLWHWLFTETILFQGQIILFIRVWYSFTENSMILLDLPEIVFQYSEEVLSISEETAALNLLCDVICWYSNSDVHKWRTIKKTNTFLSQESISYLCIIEKILIECHFLPVLMKVENRMLFQFCDANCMHHIQATKVDFLQAATWKPPVWIAMEGTMWNNYNFPK